MSSKFQITLLFLLSLLSACSDHSTESDLEIPCLHPAEFSMGSLKLVKVIAPGSAWQIAKDLTSPSKNLFKYGFQYASTVEVTNNTPDPILLDSMQFNMTRENGSGNFQSAYQIKEPIVIQQNETRTIDVITEVRANTIDAQMLSDLLKQTLNSVKVSPLVFVRFSDNHVCRTAENATQGLISATGGLAFTVASTTVLWIIENPKDFLTLIEVVLSIALKVA